MKPRLDPRGWPREIVGLALCSLLFPQTSGRLAAAGGRPGAPRSPRLGRTWRVTPPGASFQDPEWSPGGRLLAFTGAGGMGLFVSAADGSGGPREVASGRIARFFWLPGSGEIAYARIHYVGGGGQLRRRDILRRVGVTGGPDEVLLEEAGPLSFIAPTREGLVRYRAGGRFAWVDRWGRRAVPVGLRPEPIVVEGAEGDIELLSERGELERRLTVGGGRCCPRISPDGRWVLSFDKRRGGLVVLSLGGPGETFLGGGDGEDWSPDSEWIVYAATQEAEGTVVAGDLFAVHRSGGAHVRLTDTPGRMELRPRWSPEGGRVAFPSGGEEGTSVDAGGIFVADVEWR